MKIIQGSKTFIGGMSDEANVAIEHWQQKIEDFKFVKSNESFLWISPRKDGAFRVKNGNLVWKLECRYRNPFAPRAKEIINVYFKDTVIGLTWSRGLWNPERWGVWRSREFWNPEKKAWIPHFYPIRKKELKIASAILNFLNISFTEIVAGRFLTL